MGETIYTAVFFGGDGWKNPHMTLTFRPTDQQINDTPFGETVAVAKIGEMSTDEFYGIAVEPVSENIPIVSSGQPHITFGTFGDFKPGNISDRMKDNPEIIIPTPPTMLIGRIGRFMSDGSVRFD